MKAQSQCRATLETLAAIKAGPVVIARQANIAHGPQQVNNGVAANNAQTPARAEQLESAKSELLENRRRRTVETVAPSNDRDAMLASD
jgi:hypothetical protein